MLLAAGGVGCTQLVDESYGSVDERSINGLDAFYALLRAESDEVFESGFLTRRVRSEADMMVFFDRSFQRDMGYYLQLEAWLMDANPDELESPDESDDFEEIDEALRGPSRLNRQSAQHPALQTTDENETVTEPPDRYKTLLYFLRDTTASVAFWERLTVQMQEHPDQLEYCQNHYADRLQTRNNVAPDTPIPFGFRHTEYPGGTIFDRLIRRKNIFNGRFRFPARSIPGRPESHFGLTDFSVRRLLATENRDPLIREFLFENARMILVYNAEPFLNYSLVDSANRRLTRDLIRYGLNHTGSGSGKVAIITNRPVPVDRAAREEQNVFAMLLVYPLNVVLLHFIVLLVLFLISRWPHDRPPLKQSPPGSREFLEHIQALGIKLFRSRDHHEGLEPLIDYRKKYGGDINEALTGSVTEPDAHQTQELKASNNSIDSEEHKQNPYA